MIGNIGRVNIGEVGKGLKTLRDYILVHRMRRCILGRFGGWRSPGERAWEGYSSVRELLTTLKGQSENSSTLTRGATSAGKGRLKLQGVVLSRFQSYGH